MTSTSATARATPPAAAIRDGAGAAQPDARATPEHLLPAVGERGRTFIDDEVVSVIARVAAENVEGVHQLGESNLRALFSRLGGHHGVDAEVGMKEAAVDVEVVVEFGYPIRAVAQQLRRQIVETVERMTSRRVLEVNVYVIDVHIGKGERRHRRQLE